MNTKQHFKYLILLLGSLLTSIASAADINVRIDRNSIELNETFTLTFEASEGVDDDPDFSPLENDFQILNKSTSSNISIINGQYTKNQRWSVSLIAKKEGTIIIPSISFGSDKSPQYKINIKPVQKSSGKSGEEFMSELEVSTTSAYPQSQIIVTQRMLSSRNINGYEFSPLKMNGLDVSKEPLGDIKQFQTQRGKTPYLVLEQSFAVYPQTTGTLTIEPSVASARLALNSRSTNPFRSNTKTVRRASGSKTVKVKAIPGAFKGSHWLPAREVQLVEEFPQNSDFKVGEPITRTLSLLVDGQSASQLPEFSIDEITGLKQYPDKPALKDTPGSDGITGIQQIKVAIIPTHKGRFTLPAISVPWWNTQTDKLEIASIPARTFNVGAAVASTTPQPEPIEQAPIADIEITDAPATITAPTLNQPPAASPVIWQLLTLFFAIAWMVTLFLFWKARHNHPKSDSVVGPIAPTLKQANAQLKAACEKADPQACKDALLNWGNTLFPNNGVYSLGELARRVNAPLAENINALNSALYKKDTEHWHCNELLANCQQFAEEVLKQNSKNNKEQTLADLYQ